MFEKEINGVSGDNIIFIRNKDYIGPVTIEDFYNNYDVKDYQTIYFDFDERKYMWSNIEDIVKFEELDTINVVCHRGYSITCSPNFNFYDYKTKDRKKSPYGLISASDLEPKSRIINHKNIRVLDNVYNENRFGTLIGVLLLSTINIINLNGYIYIEVGFKSDEDVVYFKNILDDLDIKYTKKEKSASFDYYIGDNTVNKEENRNSFYIGLNNIGNKYYDILNEHIEDNNINDIIPFCYQEDLLLGVFSGLLNIGGTMPFIKKEKKINIRFNFHDKDVLSLFYNISFLLGFNPSTYNYNEGVGSLKTISFPPGRAYHILDKINLKKSFREKIEQNEFKDYRKQSINGLCTVKEIFNSKKQPVYKIKIENDSNNCIVNNILVDWGFK